MAASLAVVGCVMPGPYGRPGTRPDLKPPVIAAFAVECDLEEGRWTITVEATSWTGGATSWWTADGEYVEKHVLDSISYEPDGTAESLFAEIAIVSDWRLLSPRNTAFTCAEEPDVVVHLLDVAGHEADCSTWGDPTTFTAVEGVDPCPVP